jgi:hypothetical protein
MQFRMKEPGLMAPLTTPPPKNPRSLASWWHFSRFAGSGWPSGISPGGLRASAAVALTTNAAAKINLIISIPPQRMSSSRPLPAAAQTGDHRHQSRRPTSDDRQRPDDAGPSWVSLGGVCLPLAQALSFGVAATSVIGRFATTRERVMVSRSF